MTNQQSTSQPSESPILRAIGGFLRFLLRFLLVVIIGALIGWGVYYAVPWFYRNVVQPVRRNTVLIETLGQRMEQEQTRLQEETLALQKSIDDLKAEVTTLQEDSAVQAQAIEETAGQIQQLEGRITVAEEDLDAQAQVAQATRSELEGAIADLDGQADQVAGQAEELEGRLALLQTAQDLLKVRLLLLEENTGAARDALTLATAHLEQAVPLMPKQAETLSALQERMVGLDGLIEERSYRVGPELESLWADVMNLVLPAVPPPAGESAS
jgi:chromosome segregation ATPase